MLVNVTIKSKYLNFAQNGKGLTSYSHSDNKRTICLTDKVKR